ncbi:MAG: hypothetical protein CM15mP83_8850 [Flavobacteriaceae bacterium]|nr:MAG: hypothetical protein CM15mP83_8850 [Flavobacteriaceae bacterium]
MQQQHQSCCQTYYISTGAAIRVFSVKHKRTGSDIGPHKIWDGGNDGLNTVIPLNQLVSFSKQDHM